LVPRFGNYSTGAKQMLFGMSKRGNIYLRRMLIHDARAVLFRVKHGTVGLGQWVHRLSQRAPRNKMIAAIAETSTSFSKTESQHARQLRLPHWL
jgi:transposase